LPLAPIVKEEKFQSVNRKPLALSHMALAASKPVLGIFLRTSCLKPVRPSPALSFEARDPKKQL
jgi:hypothetical protein